MLTAGVYVSRYKVPNKNGVFLALQHAPAGLDPRSLPAEGIERPEYDYASTDVLRNNLIKFSEPRQEDLNALQKNLPHYHVLEGIEENTPHNEFKQEACVILQKNAPYYQVLEGPGDSDKQGNQEEYADPHEVPVEAVFIDPKGDRQKGTIDEAPASDALCRAIE